MSEGYIEQGKNKAVLEIRPLRQKDVPPVAYLHALVFPEYFLNKTFNLFGCRSNLPKN